MLNPMETPVIHLRELACIHMGYTFRGSLKNAVSGNTAIIQIRDARQERGARVEHDATFARTDIARLHERYCLRPGDLIFRSRGPVNTTILIEHEMSRTICICPLMYIRILPDKPVLPAYLHWFINLPDTQQVIDAWAHGKVLRMVSATSMKRLPVVLPPLEKQQEIVSIAHQTRHTLAERIRLATIAQTQTDASLLEYARGLGQLLVESPETGENA